jgi:hypothetical protein
MRKEQELNRFTGGDLEIGSWKVKTPTPEELKKIEAEFAARFKQPEPDKADKEAAQKAYREQEEVENKRKAEIKARLAAEQTKE